MSNFDDAAGLEKLQEIAKLRHEAATFAKSHDMPHHPGDIQSGEKDMSGEDDMSPSAEDQLFSPIKSKGKVK